jgi:RNA polymerase sigma factor (sigma-70 family)
MPGSLETGPLRPPSYGHSPTEPSREVTVSAADLGRAPTPDEDFAAAYPTLFRRAMGLAYRMTRDAGASEDLAAEALARAYSRWASVRKLESPEAWVMRVTVNLVIDSARRRRMLTLRLPVLGAHAETTAGFDDQVAVRSALVAALASLPPRQREAIALRYLAELDETSVSQSLRISPSTLRTHLQRGLAGLRETLGSADDEGMRFATAT